MSLAKSSIFPCSEALISVKPCVVPLSHHVQHTEYPLGYPLLGVIVVNQRAGHMV